MAQSWDQFKECMRIESALDLEALDVAFIQPLKDIQAWYQRQTAATQKYIDFFTTGLGRSALMKFIAKAARQTVSELTDLALEALGAVLVGVALGLTVAALVHCGLDQVDPAL